MVVSRRVYSQLEVTGKTSPPDCSGLAYPLNTLDLPGRVMEKTEMFWYHYKFAAVRFNFFPLEI